MRVVNEAVRKDGRRSVGDESCLEAQVDEQLKREFDVHVQALKAEAIGQFERAAYGECLGTFQFLCELEPENPSLRRYLDGCLRFSQQRMPRVETSATDSGDLTFNHLKDVRLPGGFGALRPTNRQSETTTGPDGPQSSNDVEILEIPDDAPTGTSVQVDTAREPIGNSPMVWIKFALPALGALFLVVWLVAPRSAPNVKLSAGAESEALESSILLDKSDSATTGGRTLESFRVVHDHLIGDCKGTLRISDDALSFVPSGGSKDAFTQKLSRIKLRELDEALTIEVKGKTYRFEVGSGGSRRSKKEATARLHRILSDRIHGTQ
jgi:hypothetical protein